MNLFGRDKEMTFLLSMVLRKQAISGHFSFRNELIQRNLRGKFEYFFAKLSRAEFSLVFRCVSISISAKFTNRQTDKLTLSIV